MSYCLSDLRIVKSLVIWGMLCIVVWVNLIACIAHIVFTLPSLSPAPPRHTLLCCFGLQHPFNYRWCFYVQLAVVNYLLRVVWCVREHSGDMEHDLILLVASVE